MLICDQVKIALHILGYFPNELRIPPKYERYFKFLRKIPFQRIHNWMIFIAASAYHVQPLLFLILMADEEIEYRESCFYISHSFQTVCSYTLFVLHKLSILRIIADFEKLIDESEQHFC